MEDASSSSPVPSITPVAPQMYVAIIIIIIIISTN